MTLSDIHDSRQVEPKRARARHWCSREEMADEDSKLRALR
jgi:hypothetical protein